MVNIEVSNNIFDNATDTILDANYQSKASQRTPSTSSKERRHS